jgi:hypothetical protein
MPVGSEISPPHASNVCNSIASIKTQLFGADGAAYASGVASPSRRAAVGAGGAQWRGAFERRASPELLLRVAGRRPGGVDEKESTRRSSTVCEREGKGGRSARTTHGGAARSSVGRRPGCSFVSGGRRGRRTVARRIRASGVARASPSRRPASTRRSATVCEGEGGRSAMAAHGGAVRSSVGRRPSFSFVSPGVDAEERDRAQRAGARPRPRRPRRDGRRGGAQRRTVARRVQAVGVAKALLRELLGGGAEEWNRVLSAHGVTVCKGRGRGQGRRLQ